MGRAIPASLTLAYCTAIIGRMSGDGRSDSAGELDPVSIVSAAMRAYTRGDLEGLTAFIHPEATIEMFALGGRSAQGPVGLRETLASAADGVHRPSLGTVKAVAADAAMMVGRIQYTSADGGLTDRAAVWLSILRDGQIWRTGIFSTETEACDGYAELAGRDPA